MKPNDKERVVVEVVQRVLESGARDAAATERLLFDVHENRLLAPGGIVGMTAVRDQVAYPWSLLHGTEARIETSCHFDRENLRALLSLYKRGQIRIEPMVSHLVPIGEAPAIYETLANRGDELLGVIFDWS